MENSLTSVHQALHLLNRVSSYKVKEMKSYILDMGVPTNIKLNLKHIFPYVWKDSRIDYLGITLTPGV